MTLMSQVSKSLKSAYGGDLEEWPSSVDWMPGHSGLRNGCKMEGVIMGYSFETLDQKGS